MISPWITGVGTSRFAVQPDTTYESLVADAVIEAMVDAEVRREHIEAIYVGTIYSPPGTVSRAMRAVGLAGIPTLSIETACCSSTAAFHQAQMAVAAGMHRTVLAVGVERMSDHFDGPIDPELTDPEGRTGLVMPAYYSLQAARYMHEYDVSAAALAQVAVKNRRHGLANDRVAFGRDCTVEDVLASRMIASPLTLLQCCPQTDGASAAVVTSQPRDPHRAVRVRASAFLAGEAWGTGSGPWSVATVTRTAAAAYEQASLGPEDLDVVEVHDAFTIGEILSVEAIGLAPTGSGHQLATSGATAIGGKVPVNPSGGLLSRGHPVGATGLAQLAEIAWQLRGEAGRRQVDGARIGLVETMGGGASGIDGNACVVVILDR